MSDNEVKTIHDRNEFQTFLIAGIEAKMGSVPKKIRIRHKCGNITGLELIWDIEKAYPEQVKMIQDTIDEIQNIMDKLGS